MRFRIRTALLAGALAAAALSSPASSEAALRVVASISDLGSIASSVGGSEVEVMAISRPAGDPHRVEVLPSYMVRVSRAKLYLKVGLGLDQWADPIIDGSQNGNLVTVDCSKGVPVLEKPTGKVDASMGDVHPDGNPHYWLDPKNGGIVARTIAEALSRVDPAHAADYAARAEAYAAEADSTAARGARAAAMLPVKEILTYHRSWSYLANALGLTVASTVEPIPGIPPTGKHLDELVTIAKQRNVRILLEEPYFSEDAGEFLAREAGIHAVRVSASCDDVTAGSALRHFDDIVRLLTEGSGGGAAPGER